MATGRLNKLFQFLALPVLAGLAVGLVVLWWHQYGPGTPASQEPMVSDNLRVDSYADAVARAAPAVVNIYTTQIITRNSRPFSDQPPFNRFMQPRRERAFGSLGSGVLVTSEGYILTSYHVIRDADEILVALRDGRDAPARVVGTDPETDLALLEIAMEDLPHIELDGPQPVSVGDVVLAIGNPLGVGQTVSLGIVGATGRKHLGIATFENFIQTDAAINKGNSGGALVNTQGHLIGINTAMLSRDGSWQGISFSIPASIASRVMSDLIEHGRVIRGFLGVSVQENNPTLAETFGMSDVIGGVVTEVKSDGPAQKAGLQAGDVLLAINGDTMESGYQAMNRITSTQPGTKLTLTVRRNSQELTLDVTIGTRPPADE